jgi:DNA-binding NtrC family response regulator
MTATASNYESPIRPAPVARPEEWDDEQTGVRLRPAEVPGVHLEFPLMHYVDARTQLGPMEVDYVAWALLGERGNRSATARRLALTRTTFLRHLKRLGLEDLIPEEEAREYQMKKAG